MQRHVLQYMLCIDLCIQASLSEELNVLVETNKELRGKMNAIEYVCINMLQYEVLQTGH